MITPVDGEIENVLLISDDTSRGKEYPAIIPNDPTSLSEATTVPTGENSTAFSDISNMYELLENIGKMSLIFISVTESGTVVPFGSIPLSCALIDMKYDDTFS